jgi:outer membrane protein
MKTPASMISKITLTLLLAGSLAACNQNKTDDKATPAATTPTRYLPNTITLKT